MSKHIYRAVKINKVAASALQDASGQRLVVGIDVAKETCFAQAMVPGSDGGPRRLLQPIRFEQSEVAQLLALLRSAQARSVEVALEPTGTYGDALCGQLHDAGVAVYLVSAKRAHDAAEVFDGVPSMHDAKAADVLARLHWQGISRAFAPKSDKARALSAAVKLVMLYDARQQRLLGQLEALLVRHWPELTQKLSLTTKTSLALVARYGSAQAVSADQDGARELMTTVSRRRLAPDKIETVLGDAASSRGVAPVEAERRLLQTLASEAQQALAQLEMARKQTKAETANNEAVKHIAPVVGSMTAAVLVNAARDPSAYDSARQYVKALGLNLKERSSGRHAGQLRITKRGPAKARQYLYLAALRLIHSDAVVAAWYQRKVARDGGRGRNRAVVAVMRKLAQALHHVAGGAAFDSTKLFDTNKLQRELHAA